MRSIDDITRDLAAIQDELLGADESDLAAIAEIKRRQAALRDEAAQFAGQLSDAAPTEALKRELAAHRENLLRLRRQRIDLVKQAGTGVGTSPDAIPEGTLNRKLMDAQGAREIETRIAELEALLERRGVTDV